MLCISLPICVSTKGFLMKFAQVCRERIHRESERGGLSSAGAHRRRAKDRAEGRAEQAAEGREERLVLPAEPLPAVPGAPDA